MVLPEGGSLMMHNLTQIIDGFAGNEHALTAAPLYKDVVELLAQTRTSYTTTLQISHGGPPAQNFYIERDAPQADAKLRHFSPPLLAFPLTSRSGAESSWRGSAGSLGRLRSEGVAPLLPPMPGGRSWHEIGSLEPGKYADLVVLDRDPRADIRNALAIASVMKNGRLYDAATLDEIYPEPRKLAKQWFNREREREEADSPSTP